MEKFLIETLERKINECDQIMAMADDIIASGPTETLHVSKQRERYYLYVYDENKTEVYLKRKDVDYAKKMAEVEYYSNLKDSARTCKYHLKGLLKFLKEDGFNKAFKTMHKEKRKLISDAQFTNDTLTQNWLDFNYPHMPQKEDGLLTKKGDRVRSKTEKMMADLMFDLGIPYRYEPTIVLKDGTMYSPDFMILDVATGEEILVEHFGLMENGKYSADAVKKMSDYIENGYCHGYSIMFTFELMPLEVFQSWLEFRFDAKKFSEKRLVSKKRQRKTATSK